MVSTKAIDAKRLTKKYGNFLALDNLDLAIESGSCIGYLGPNGAGKTTTIKLLSGLSKPTSGEAYVFGRKVGGNEARRILLDMGLMTDCPTFEGFLTPVEILSYFGKLRGMTYSEIVERTKQVLELVKMTEWRDKKIGSFSRGMVQRFALASALLHDPELLILDEPMSGLDPRGRIELREIILSLKKSGKTIFMSTHLLSETEELCDTVAVIAHGKLIRMETVTNINDSLSVERIMVQLLEELSPSQFSLMQRMNNVVSLQRHQGLPSTYILTLNGNLAARAEFLAKCFELGLKVTSFASAEKKLESFYMEAVPDAVD